MADLFPGDFQKGVAVSVWQNSPDTWSNWGQFCRGYRFGIFPNVYDRSDPNKQSDFWNNYRIDIQNAHELGCNAFRFSFEWSRIEPEQGKIEATAIARYHDIIACMKEFDMEPSATLHHFTHPWWFEKLGAFEKEKNIKYFVEYATVVFQEFQSEVRIWATFNEPSISTVFGYLCGMHCPAYFFRFRLCGRCLLHMLRAHTEVYRKLKKLPGGDKAQIGLVHHANYTKSYSKSIFYIIPQYVASYMTHWIGWDLVAEYLSTGKFRWSIPWLLLDGGFTFKEKGNWEPPLDWFGINYYTRNVIGFFCQPVILKGEVMSELGYAVCADGLYESIKKYSTLGCPIYITETGAPDKKDCGVRVKWIQSYTNAIWKAIRNGYDVRGLYYWTLNDNFEWQVGFSARFGLYQWEPDGSVNRKLREGSKTLQNIYKTIPSNYQNLKLWLNKKQVVLGEEEQEEEVVEKENIQLLSKQEVVMQPM